MHLNSFSDHFQAVHILLSLFLTLLAVDYLDHPLIFPRKMSFLSPQSVLWLSFRTWNIA